MATTIGYRVGTFDLLVGGAAVVVTVAISALLQHAGVTQPYAMAAAMAAGLLALYPAMRRWSRADVPLYKWALVIAAIVVISLSLHLLLLRV
jgi:putative flippase GtrA